jgi:hypothetical protein
MWFSPGGLFPPKQMANARQTKRLLAWCAQGPQLIIVVPTRELGVQTVMLIYKLLGGSINSGIPGDPTNMFAYSGPRGIRVSGTLSGIFMR